MMTSGAIGIQKRERLQAAGIITCKMGLKAIQLALKCLQFNKKISYIYDL